MQDTRMIKLFINLNFFVFVFIFQVADFSILQYIQSAPRRHAVLFLSGALCVGTRLIEMSVGAVLFLCSGNDALNMT